MKIGLIDVDGHNFPNLALMKLSAWHKDQGDSVEWYEPLIGGHYDRVYMSKVFSFTRDYEYPINADEVIKGGTGYNIQLINGRETYTKDKGLPKEIEHMYPDYDIYGITDTAYGFMTRGCPRGCDFCIVGQKEGKRSITVAPLEEFWKGQKNIVLLDPNPIAAPDWESNLQQLKDSNAWIDFNQGVDLRMMTERKAEIFRDLKIKRIHFAWDRYEDKEIVTKKLKMFMDVTEWKRWKVTVYILTNFNTTIEQDLERIYTVRDLGADPYVMVYNKANLPKGHVLYRIRRWVNNRRVFATCKRFEDYTREKG